MRTNLSDRPFFAVQDEQRLIILEQLTAADRRLKVKPVSGYHTGLQTLDRPPAAQCGFNLNETTKYRFHVKTQVKSQIFIFPSMVSALSSANVAVF